MELIDLAAEFVDAALVGGLGVAQIGDFALKTPEFLLVDLNTLGPAGKGGAQQCKND